MRNTVGMAGRMRIAMMLLFMGISAGAANAAAVNSEVKLSRDQIKVGSRIDLTGAWLYKPGYAVTADEHPEDPSQPQQGYVSVPVPQMLSRINWWLDDSKGFNEYETKRLAALGFDTEKAEDGWYRLWLDFPELNGRRVFISFDGVAMKCRVYLNGHKLGEHTGMFSRFGWDITPHVRPGRNLLAVYVSMEKLDPEVVSLGEAVTVNLTLSKVVSLSKGMFGPLSPVPDNRAYDLHGIWQPARLEICDRGRIEDAWFIPELDGAEVRVDVSSVRKQDRAVLSARWTDVNSGEILHKIQGTSVTLTPDKQTVTLSANGLKPKLWTPEQPNLYLLEVTLQDMEGKVLDVWRHKVGFRTIEFRGNKLYLNGRVYWLRGANQLPYGKNPWNAELPKKLIQLAHDGNTLITRTHCTPWNEAWLEAADEIGLGVSIEGIRPWALVGARVPPPSREMIEHWKMENEDVIKRCRNHPSVLLWTVGNEMNLRDDNDIEKWEILSEMVKQTRSLDPTRPVICSSGFHRDRKLYEERLKPKGIDDGDAEDLHSYRGWYAPSPFVQDSSWIEKSCDYAGIRPIIGQEMATGYPDLDTGLPVEKYIQLLVPQVWVGVDGEKGGDPSAFLEHNRAVTKRLAEQLRFQRGDLTSGFLLFSSECWFKNSYDPVNVSPYPVYEAVKFAFAPVGLALETSNRRFFGGESFDTSVFITNDLDDLTGPLELVIEFADTNGKVVASGGRSVLPGGIAYYATVKVPVTISIPSVDTRRKMILRARLLQDESEIGRTEDPVEVFSWEWSESPLKRLKANSIAAIGIGERLTKLLSTAPKGSVNLTSDLEAGWYSAAFIGPNMDILEKDMGSVRRFVENGGTAVILSAGVQIGKLFPEYIAKSRETHGEFVETKNTRSELTNGMDRYDFKWWGRGDNRAYVISATHNLKPGADVKPLASHIVVHGYISDDKKSDYVTSPLIEIPSGKGRFIICEFNLEDSIDWDPAARRFAANLLAWGGTAVTSSE